MHPITLTTTIRNSATLPLLLKITDELHAKGLLTMLRVVDCTSKSTEKAEIRNNIPMDGVTKTRSIVTDFATVREKDSKTRILTGLTGYHYKTTEFKLVRGGPFVTVAIRSSHGGSVWISQGSRGRSGVELVFGPSECFLRRGKGGGARVHEVATSGVAYEGMGWRAAELRIGLDGNLTVKLDTDDVLSCSMDDDSFEFEVNVSSSPIGISDIVVTSVAMYDLGSTANRSYAYYYSTTPDPVGEGVELLSQNDIVYIDQSGWRSLFFGAVPLVIGDLSSFSACRRAGLFNECDFENVHKNFLDRSFRCIERTRQLLSLNVSINVDGCTSIVVNGTENPTFGPPVLICTLDSRSVINSEIVARYSSLLDFGPIGEELAPAAEDIIAYLDSVIEGPKFDAFLLELVERLNSSRRSQLLKLLSR